MQCMCAIHVCNSCVQCMCTACAPHVHLIACTTGTARTRGGARAAAGQGALRRRPVGTARRKSVALDVATCCPGRLARAPSGLGCSAYLRRGCLRRSDPSVSTRHCRQPAPKAAHFAPLDIQLGALCAAAAASARRVARCRRADVARQGKAGQRARRSRACVHTPGGSPRVPQWQAFRPYH